MLLLILALTPLVYSAPITNVSLPLDCEDVYILKKTAMKNASVPNGVYTIYPAGPNKPVKVFCEMGCEEDDSHQDGRWTVIQRRIDGNVSFYQSWNDYRDGFGDASGEYWLGDSLSYVNGRPFATFDKDQTGYCADTNGGGFWYSYYYWYYYYYYYNYGYCHIANPNGLYKSKNVNAMNTGIIWQTWKGNYYSLKSIVMKVRRIGLEDIENL
ncbi:microfibril-associated glycoprotein 4-like [Silurus meridionalis]|nr:microfibril-associated glycoprotein 4-like [Silurus meridionalis]